MSHAFPLWYPEATKVEFSKRNAESLKWKFDDDQWWAVVNHVAQGTTMNWFTYTCKTRSAHFNIDPDGTVYQTVPLNLCAWHAGRMVSPTWSKASRVPRKNRYITLKKPNPNLVGIGIEHAGFTAPPTWLKDKSPVSYRKAVEQIYRASYPWPEPMVEATLKLHEWFFDEGVVAGPVSVDNVIGHNQIDSVSRANDPGQQFYDQVFPQILNVSSADTKVNHHQGKASPLDLADQLAELSQQVRKDSIRVAAEINAIAEQLSS